MNATRSQTPPDPEIEEFRRRLGELADDCLCGEHQAAAMLDMSVHTLRGERETYAKLLVRDPEVAKREYDEWMVPIVPVGKRGVRYRLGDLRAYVRRPPRPRGRRGATPEPELATGFETFAKRLDAGLLPFAVVAGEPRDFVAAVGEDVDAVEWLAPAEADAVRAAGARLAPPPAA